MDTSVPSGVMTTPRFVVTWRALIVSGSSSGSLKTRVRVSPDRMFTGCETGGAPGVRLGSPLLPHVDRRAVGRGDAHRLIDEADRPRVGARHVAHRDGLVPAQGLRQSQDELLVARAVPRRCRRRHTACPSTVTVNSEAGGTLDGR